MKGGTGGFITMADKIYAHLIKAQTFAARGRISHLVSKLAWLSWARVKWELKTLTRTNN